MYLLDCENECCSQRETMPRLSAGLLMYRQRSTGLEVLLVHPGGPFWARKDAGVWSVPKGEYTADEDPLTAARREFLEETGVVASGNFVPLTPLTQPSGKVITVWAFEGDCDASAIRSNTFEMEWPPQSGRQRTFPEVDRGAWFPLPEARQKILPGQRGFLDDLHHLVTPRP